MTDTPNRICYLISCGGLTLLVCIGPFNIYVNRLFTFLIKPSFLCKQRDLHLYYSLLTNYVPPNCLRSC